MSVWIHCAQAVALNVREKSHSSIATCMRYRSIFGIPPIYTQSMKSCVRISWIRRFFSIFHWRSVYRRELPSTLSSIADCICAKPHYFFNVDLLKCNNSTTPIITIIIPIIFITVGITCQKIKSNIPTNNTPKYPNGIINETGA